MTNEQGRIMLGKLTLALAYIFLILYLIWAFTITFNIYNLALTRWNNLKLYGEPLLYFALPGAILYIASAFINPSKR